ncbi:UNVERIFIED_CONTAM: Insulin-degrading enzyme-like 2, partial [Sesamum radiatum]
MAVGGITDEVQIIKPRNDKREYRKIVLQNNLQVLLISDSETDKCAASMDVRVGSFSDPEGLEGLAHFLVTESEGLAHFLGDRDCILHLHLSTSIHLKHLLVSKFSLILRVLKALHTFLVTELPWLTLSNLNRVDCLRMH